MASEFTSVDEMRLMLRRIKDGESVDSVLSDISDEEWADQHKQGVWQAVFFPEDPELARNVCRRHHEAFAKKKADLLLRVDSVDVRAVLTQLVLVQIEKYAEWEMENKRYSGLHYRDVAAIYAKHLPSLDVMRHARDNHASRLRVAGGVADWWTDIPIKCGEAFSESLVQSS